MAAAFDTWKVVAPATGNVLTKPYPFNLMFTTTIGPSGMFPGFLRPETAQGIFVNFKRLLEINGGRLPFACAQIGESFRNEIAPKSGLLRAREFAQAEIEHFVHPDDKSHPGFPSVKDVVLNLFPRDQQLTTRETVKMTAGDAVSNGIVANEALAFFIARTHLFMERIGMDIAHVRFRQHLEHEMAHYACDCWDLEVENSYGWIECAGLADRSCFDLKNHSEAAQVELKAWELFSEPKVVEELTLVPNKGLLGKSFRKDAQKIMKRMEEMSVPEREALQRSLTDAKQAKLVCEGGVEFTLTPEMVTSEVTTTKLSGQWFYPSVIEPSFGIGRILYCLFEHNYYAREGGDEARVVLGLAPAVAPVKAMILPLSKNEVFDPLLRRVGQAFGAAGLVYRVDDSGVGIGRRYARADEIGVPFGVTVDFEAVKVGTVTLRERDSMKQVRGDVDEVVRAVAAMVEGRETWAEVAARMPAFEAGEE